MIRIQSVRLLLLLATLWGCGAAPIVDKPPAPSDASQTKRQTEQGVFRQLRKNSYIKPSKDRCVAKAVTRLFAKRDRYPTTADWLAIQSCCGPTFNPQSVSCQRGSLADIKGWFTDLPGDMRTGRLGMAAIAVPSPAVMCVVRLDGGEILPSSSQNVVSGSQSTGSKGYYLRRLALNGDISDRPLSTEPSEVLEEVDNNQFLSVEIRQTLQERGHSQLVLASRNNGDCTAEAAENSPPLNAKQMIRLINIVREKRSLSTLTHEPRFKRPLDTWMERAVELGTRRPVVGMLDSRGWSLPRIKYVRFTANSIEQFKTLLGYHPTLRLLAVDPYTTSIATAQRDQAKRSEWLLAFLQTAKAASAEQIEGALLSDLNRQQSQRGHDPIIRQERPKESLGKLLECWQARQNLLQEVNNPKNSRIWLKSYIQLGSDLSQPSCQIRFGWVAPPSQAAPIGN